MDRVSVPSRGLSYLNQEVSTAGFCSAISFRPLTGTLLSKQIGIRLLPMFSTYVSVPSRGLSYLNTVGILMGKCIRKLSFRPLTGTLLSKPDTENSEEYLAEQGFRPLTGTLLSKQISVVHWIEFSDVSFRPLTGTLLSKHHPPILPPQAAFFAGLRGK